MNTLKNLNNWITEHKDEISCIWCGTVAYALILSSGKYDYANQTYMDITCKHNGDTQKIDAQDIIVVKKSSIEHIDINIKITKDGVEF